MSEAQRTVDVAIVGAGVMGAVSAWTLARRGYSVVLLDQHPLPHDRGSSHGASRIFRLAYNEAEYVILARRSLDLWRAMESLLGRQLLLRTGAVDIGPARYLDPLQAALEGEAVDLERLSPQAAAARLPAFHLPAGWEAIYHPDGGVLLASDIWAALVAGARDRGADVRGETRVHDIIPGGEAVEVRSDDGTWIANRVVLAAAGWSNALLTPLGLHVPFVTTREHVAYYHLPSPHGLLPFIWHAGSATPEVYGLPNGLDGSLKVGDHGAGPRIDPDDPPEIDEALLNPIDNFVRRVIPGLETAHPRIDTCLYAATPDDDFVLDRIGPVVLALGFGGHGFKFAPVIGEIVADLVADGNAPPSPRFGLARFASPSHT